MNFKALPANAARLFALLASIMMLVALMLSPSPAGAEGDDTVAETTTTTEGTTTTEHQVTVVPPPPTEPDRPDDPQMNGPFCERNGSDDNTGNTLWFASWTSGDDLEINTGSGWFIDNSRDRLVLPPGSVWQIRTTRDGYKSEQTYKLHTIHCPKPAPEPEPEPEPEPTMPPTTPTTESTTTTQVVVPVPRIMAAGCITEGQRAGWTLTKVFADPEFTLQVLLEDEWVDTNRDLVTSPARHPVTLFFRNVNSNGVAGESVRADPDPACQPPASSTTSTTVEDVDHTTTTEPSTTTTTEATTTTESTTTTVDSSTSTTVVAPQLTDGTPGPGSPFSPTVVIGTLILVVIAGLVLLDRRLGIFGNH